MSENLNTQEEDLLQSALSDAFSPAAVPRVSAQPPVAPAEPQAEPEAPAPAEESTPTLGSASGEEAERWKSDYEAHVAEWRERSAHQRQKSEAERARWEAIRAEEEREGRDWSERVLEERRAAGLGSSMASSSGWTKAETPEGAEGASSVTRGVPREAKPRSAEPSSTLSSPPVTVSNEANHGDSEPESSKHDKWEDIPSDLTSSYPSINFPSDIHSPSSSNQHQRLPPPEPDHQHHPHHHHEQTRGSATSAVFDSTLSKRTRLLALASSVAINLLLPFINGVMLGFGELFAKNVVLGWFGWKNAGATAANIGIRRSQPPRKKEL